MATATKAKKVNPPKELVAIYPVGETPGPPYRVSAEDAKTYVDTGEYSYDDPTLEGRDTFATPKEFRNVQRARDKADNE